MREVRSVPSLSVASGRVHPVKLRVKAGEDLLLVSVPTLSLTAAEKYLTFKKTTSFLNVSSDAPRSVTLRPPEV